MTHAQRTTAVLYLRSLGSHSHVTGPVLAARIGCDPDDIREILAEPIAKRQIAMSRHGACLYFSAGSGALVKETRPMLHRVVHVDGLSTEGA